MFTIRTTFETFTKPFCPESCLLMEELFPAWATTNSTRVITREMTQRIFEGLYDLCEEEGYDFSQYVESGLSYYIRWTPLMEGYARLFPEAENEEDATDMLDSPSLAMQLLRDVCNTKSNFIAQEGVEVVSIRTAARVGGNELHGGSELHVERLPKERETPMHEALSKGSAFLLNADGQIIILHQGAMTNVASDHHLRDQIYDQLQQSNYAGAIQLANKREAVRQFFLQVDGLTVRTQRGQLFLNEEALPDEMAEAAMNMLVAGASPEPLVRFLSRLNQNSDRSVKDQLLPFLQKNDFYIDEQGYIVAWKKVSEDLQDLWTRKLDYSPPRTVTMPREMVNPNPSETCGRGLHFATWDFTYNYNGLHGRVVELRICPSDVVSIPTAHVEKGRCCTFKVVSEVTDWQQLSSSQPPRPDGNVIAPAAHVGDELTTSQS